jgi:hypothetical protein
MKLSQPLHYLNLYLFLLNIKLRLLFLDGHCTKHTPTQEIRQKRIRAAFKTNQLDVLEAQYQKRPYLSRSDRKLLAEKLNFSEQVIKVWFQNRRFKEKTLNKGAAEALRAGNNVNAPVPVQSQANKPNASRESVKSKSEKQ